MGQLALGFRSLLIKLAVFFVMAALLAWALGGTLWPRPEIIRFDPVRAGGHEWFWQLSAGRREPDGVRWTMMVRTPGEPAAPVDERAWIEVAGPVVVADAVYYAGRPAGGPPWSLERVDGTGTARSFPMPDRLAVEQQLARLESGLDVQDRDAIERQRATVLDPARASDIDPVP
jgi:hypothetical protein